MDRIVTFDIDDTLIYTSKNAFHKTKKAGIILWFNELSWQKYISLFWRLSYEECIASFFPWININDFNWVYNSLRNEFPYQVIPWWLEIVLYLLELKYKVWILTNWPKDKTDLKLKAVLWDISDSIFSVVIDGDTLWQNKKPSWRAFEQILDWHNPNNVIHVWDSLEDYLSALEAWVGFYWVLTWYTSKEEFLDKWLKQENILESIKELWTKI